MHRRVLKANAVRLSKVVLVVALGCGGLTMAWFVGVAGASGTVRSAQANAGAKATVITVAVGKPSEFAFTLSKQSAIAPGTITFKVTNRGKAQHDFKICTTPVTSGKANSCTGKVTKILNSGQSATLTVTLTKAG